MACQLFPSGVPWCPECGLWYESCGFDLSREGDVLSFQVAESVPKGHDDRRCIHAGQCNDVGIGFHRDALYDTVHIVV